MKTKTIIFAMSFSVLLVISLGVAYAQSISLGITPPLYEVMIMPGKEITQEFTLSNNGSETIITVDIVPFTPGDEHGNPELGEFLPGYSFEDIKTWFSVYDPKINWGGSFLLPRGGARNVSIKIAPPVNAPEGDYYLTLLFKTNTEGVIGEKEQGARAIIGSNILMTVSKDGNPLKIAKITEFKAPILVDSFGTLAYSNKIANVGNAFFKPVGKISVKPIFGTAFEYELAPLNILSSSKRVIPCKQGETLTQCKVEKKILFGVYMATLSFQTDGEGQVYEKTATTVAFPFIIILGIFAAYFVLKLIKTYQTKIKR